MKKIRAQRLTWGGVPATTWEYRATSRSTGRRVIAFLWEGAAIAANGGHAPGTLVLRDMTGDGRLTPTIHDEIAIPNGTLADADAYAAARLQSVTR